MAKAASDPGAMLGPVTVSNRWSQHELDERASWDVTLDDDLQAD